MDQIDAAIWHLAGLAGGDIPNEMIPFAAKHAMVAIDVQTLSLIHIWARRWPITATRTLSTSCTAAGEAPMTRAERRRRQQRRRRAAMQRAACLALALLAVACLLYTSGPWS